MILYGENNDPAMRYEGLARAAFDDCKKWDDPWEYAAQDVYSNFHPEIGLKGKRALSTSLIKLIVDNQGFDQLEQLKKLEEQVWDAESQEDVVSIIDSSIELVNELRN